MVYEAIIYLPPMLQEIENPTRLISIMSNPIKVVVVVIVVAVFVKKKISSKKKIIQKQSMS